MDYNRSRLHYDRSKFLLGAYILQPYARTEEHIKAMKAAGKFQGGSSLYTWLCTIAKNQWLNQCRKTNRETEFPDRPIPDGEPPLE